MATLLDTFVSVFESDTADLRRGYDEAQRSTESVTDSMERADDQANETSESIGTMLGRAASFAAAAIAATQSLQGVMNRAVEINQMRQTADAIGTNITQMQAFAQTVRDAGGDIEGGISSIEELYRSMGEAAVDSESQQAQAFAGMGVALTDAQGNYRDTLDVLLDVSDAMEKMAGPEAEFFAQQLGIGDRRSIEVMIRGREELERNMRSNAEYGAVSEETAERAQAFTDSLNYLTTGMGVTRDRMVDVLLPAITWVVENLGEMVRWMNDNQDVVVGFFAAISTIVTRRFLPAMISAAGAVWATIAPFVAVAAVVAAAAAVFALIYDDVMNFVRGNDSLIGQIAEEYPAIGRLIENLGDIFGTVFDAIGSVLDWLSDNFDVSFGSIGEVVRSFIRLILGTINQLLIWQEDFIGLFSGAADGVVAVFTWLGEQIAKLMKPIMDSIGWVQDGIGSVAGTVGGWLGLNDEEEAPASGPPTTATGSNDLVLPPEVGMANSALNNAANEPMNATSRESIVNQNRGNTENSVAVGEVHVHTQATDAQGVARDVRSELDNQLKNLNAESATGIAR